MIDFLSYFGGLLGLLAGISVLSIIEIIYWFTTRLCVCKLCQARIEPVQRDLENERRIATRVKEYVKKYSNESSIHGLQFMTSGSAFQRFVRIF
ncbi:hypothetical protein ACKWTF_014324 [Chironomus riparius]